MPAVKTTVTELPESRVRVEAQVSAEEVTRRVAETAGRLGRDMKMPGFRQGKIPPPVVIQRFGREAVLDEAIRGSLGRWYVEALDAAKIHPVGEPALDVGDLPGEGQPLTFTIEIGVRPKARLGDYKGVKAPRREPSAGDAAIDEQLEELRQRLARLETADRAARRGDFVVMDYRGTVGGEPFAGGEGDDQLVELGSGRLIPGFEEQLEGARAGQELTVKVTFPEDYGAAELAGKDAEFAVTVKEVKERLLPDLDDDFAADAAGFDTLAELRDDIAAKLREADEQRAESEYREAVLEAVAGNAEVEVPDALVDARASELWERMLHSLSHQGISREMYLQISGQTEEDLLGQARPEALRALRREAVLAAVVEAEGIEVSDADLLDALQEPAVRENTKPEKLLKRLEKAGRLDELREDIAERRAVELLVEHATATPAE